MRVWKYVHFQPHISTIHVIHNTYIYTTGFTVYTDDNFESCWHIICSPLQMGDPMQLLRITGTKAKIHLDPAIAAAGDAKTTMSVSI